MRKTLPLLLENYAYHIIHYRIRKSNSKIYVSIKNQSSLEQQGEKGRKYHTSAFQNITKPQ